MKIDDAMTYGQAAEILKLHKTRIGQLVAEEKLTRIELSPGRYLISRESVEALAQARRDAARRKFGIPA